MRLEAWAIDVRRQNRSRDDGHRHKNRGAGEAPSVDQLARHLEQIDRRLEAMQEDRTNASPVQRKPAPAEPSTHEISTTDQHRTDGRRRITGRDSNGQHTRQHGHGDRSSQMMRSAGAAENMDTYGGIVISRQRTR